MDEQNKFYRYIDDKSILVITPKNALIRIRCPFAVRDQSNKIFQVDAVSDKGGLIYYHIDGQRQIYARYVVVV